MTTTPTTIDLGCPVEWFEAVLVQRSLAEFVKRTWHIVEPGCDLVWTWHLDVICDHLERVTRGEIQNLVINIPPGHMKSLLVSVAWPVWEWLTRPEERTIFSSHDLGLVLRDAVRSRLIAESEEYRRWARALAQMAGEEPWGLADDQNAKGLYENTRRGFRKSTTVMGKVTGSRGDKLVVDDPVDVKDVVRGEPSRVAERMADVVEWWDKVMSTRLNDKRTGKRVVIMQRVHTGDLAGVLAERDGWVVLCLPTEYDPTHPYAYPDDPRTEPGELLFDVMFPQDVVDTIKVELGAADFAGQHNQRPTPQEGGLFKREWIGDRHRYRADPYEIAGTCDEIAIFIDCAFKGRPKNDPVCFHVWGRRGSTRILLDRVHDRMNIVGTKQALSDTAARWPRAMLKLIEDKANGPAVVDEMGGEIQGLVAFNPDPYGDKWARASVASIVMEAGNIIVPHASVAPWIGEVLESWFGFPGAKHDEDVDNLSMMTLRWQGVDGRNTVIDIEEESGMHIPDEW